MLLYLKLGLAAAGVAAVVGLYLWISAAFQERDDLRTAVGRLAKVASDNAQVAEDQHRGQVANLQGLHNVQEFLIVRYRDAAAAKERIAHAAPLDAACAAAVAPVAGPALGFLRALPASP